MKNGGVAIHVSNHFMAITGYNSSNKTYHVIESAVYSGRGLQADSWVSASKMSSGNTNVDWYALISNADNPNPDPPTYATLSSDKTKYDLGETINFYFDSDNAINYYFRICDDTGDIFAETMISNTYSTILPAGKYSASMSAFNNSGTAHADWINFEVVGTAPTYAILSSDKTKHDLDKTINFYFDSDNAINYYLRICDDSGDIFAETMTANTYSTILPAGKYSASMSAFNNSGTAHSDWINLEVVDASASVIGDVNNDSKLTIADAVILQKWLLAVPDTELANWKATDLCEDGKLDAFDMIEMRKLLIQNNSLSPQ